MGWRRGPSSRRRRVRRAHPRTKGERPHHRRRGAPDGRPERPGRGLACELGLEDRAWARVLGFGKAMGCSGGACKERSVDESKLSRLRKELSSVQKQPDPTSSTTHAALISTTAMLFPSLASIEVTYSFLISEQGRPAPAASAHPCLADAQATPRRDVIRASFSSTRPSQGPPIIPVFTSQPRSMARYWQRIGFMLRPIAAPTVPEGSGEGQGVPACGKLNGRDPRLGCRHRGVGGRGHRRER